MVKLLPTLILMLLVFFSGGCLTNNAKKACSNKLKQICLAVHSYNDSTRYLPPQAFAEKSAKPGLSWRVAILPYLGHKDLYEEFHLEEPWDSSHNKALLTKMPDVYRHPLSSSSDAKKGLTHFQVFVGPNGPAVLSSETGKRRITAIPDGTSNTILVAEASNPVPWTEPEDISYSSSGLPAIGGLFGKNCHVGMCDGSVHIINMDKISPTTLHNAIGPDDGMTLGSDW